MLRSSSIRAFSQARSLRYASKGKEIVYGSEARQRMLRGVEKIAKAVSVTLGPKGRNVILEKSYGAPKVTKDGVTVAKEIDLTDPFENLGCSLIKQVANTTNDIAGDGTTTSTVLAAAILGEGAKAVAQGRSTTEMKRGIDLAVDTVVKSLRKQSKEIQGKDEIKQVATISANGDVAIGQLIADAMEKVTSQGVITTQDGKTVETQLEVVEGLSIDRGYISPYFITNAKTQKVELEDPFVLVSGQKLSSLTQLMHILNYVVKSTKPLMIIADDVEGELLTTLVLNKLQGRVKVCCVKAPGFGDNKLAMLQDIAIATGAELITDDTGSKSEQIDQGVLGSARKITVSKDQTIIMSGSGDQKNIQERADSIKGAIARSDSTWEKEKFQERLARLTGGVAVIKVGGASEVEVGEKKDRVIDALNATRAAIEEGIVAGGGSALLYASKDLKELLKDQSINEDQRIGINIIYNSLRLPIVTIAANAGVDGSVIAHNVLSKDDPKYGYDALNDKYVDMFASGIVDPTKVVKTALVDAASVAGMMMTTECAIVDIPDKTPAASPPSGMDMY